MPWFLPALAIGVGAIAAKKAWDHFHARSAFDRAKQCTSRDAPEGALVRIEGRAEAVGPPLRAPLSATPCVAWRVELEVFRRGEDSGLWEPHAHDESRETFAVSDDAGRVLVPASKLEWSMSADWQIAEGSEAVTTFLATRGHGSGETYRYREDCIRPGQAIAVAGIARWNDAPDAPTAGYRDRGRVVTLDAPDVGWIRIRR